jgi:hypothetical protein
MYDFYFGTEEQIQKNEEKFLLSIKRMMPRWVNSLPDSEFLALAEIVNEQGKNLKSGGKLVTVETGAGASTLVFAFYAMKYNGIAYSWDYNSEKGSLIRTICNETMCNYFKKHINDYWKLIGHDSLSPYLGLPILHNLVNHVDVFFHDSEHTWKTVKAEIETVNPLLIDGSVVAIDDANQDFLHTNMAYINTYRKKLGLDAIAEVSNNNSGAFYINAQELLSSNWENVEHIQDLYKKSYMNDPYFAYYDSEFEIKSSLGTERLNNLEHRFDSWRVANRKK